MTSNKGKRILRPVERVETSDSGQKNSSAEMSKSLLSLEEYNQLVEEIRSLPEPTFDESKVVSILPNVKSRIESLKQQSWFSRQAADKPFYHYANSLAAILIITIAAFFLSSVSLSLPALELLPESMTEMASMQTIEAEYIFAEGNFDLFPEMDMETLNEYIELNADNSLDLMLVEASDMNHDDYARLIDSLQNGSAGK